ncbi:MAG: hypothetical protein AAGE65_01690 [Planctomycetota bacterium]
MFKAVPKSSAGRLAQALPAVSIGVATLAWSGCNAAPNAALTRVGAAGDIAPSWTGPGVRPAAPAVDVAGMVDPIAEVRRQRAAQLAAPARPVITPEVVWGEPDFADAAPIPVEPSEPTTQVFETSVRSAEQRLDLTRSDPAEAAESPEALAVEADPAPLYAGVETLTQTELLDELHRRLNGMDAPPLRKALAASGLSLIRPGLTADQAVKDRLDPTQAALLDRFEKLLAELARRIEAGDLAELDAQVVAEAIAAMQGPSSLTLRNATLCKRVSGFGVYEPFASTEFVAGREHRAIIYAEVEDFTTLPLASGNAGAGFEVKLEQEVTLFNEADGLAVWQQPAQPIHDVSKRKRRDFYNVQMLTLPANLGVGKYRLKVRVTDLHGGTVDEATLPISLIADDAVRGLNGSPTAVTPFETPEPDLTDTQRELLRTLAPGLFTE